MLTEVRSCIFRFYAATVLNNHLLGPEISTDLTELLANQQKRILRLLWILMVQRIADRPDWFIGDTQPGEKLWRNVRQSLRS